MDVAVMVLGAVAEAAAWWLVARRGKNVWTLVAGVLAVAGALALATGDVRLSGRGTAPAAAVGVGAGLALYLATRAFVAVVRGWEVFRRHAGALYGRGESVPIALRLLLGAGVAAVGEELLWRGLFQARLAQETGRTGGAMLAWLAFVGVNLPSLNLAVIAGAVVGGAAWVGLAWWSGGVLASLCCHALWTGLMIAAPPVAEVPSS